MLSKGVTLAIWAAVAAVGAANAQTLDQIGGPRELPPASYKGQMYVDSRGCVFLRAGLGGQVSWVARVNNQRRVLCGYPPTLAAGAAPAPAAAPVVRLAQAPAAPAVPPAAPALRAAAGQPINTVASLTTPPLIRAQPVVPVVSQTAYVAAPLVVAVAPTPVAPPAAPPVVLASGVAVNAAPLASTPGPGRIGCYRTVPVAQLYATADGGRVVLCTRGDGTLAGARAPIYGLAAQGVGGMIGAGIYPPPAGGAARVAQNTVQAAGAAGQPTQMAALPAVPRGYRRAWRDDRLNPNRARGTAAGQAQQDQIWTRDVPALLVADQPVRRQTPGFFALFAPQAAPQPVRVQVSTKSEPTARVAAPASAADLYVQVGTFGQPANADGAKARLRAAGLPAATAGITKAGKALQIVLAGPFADAGAAQAALAAAHGAGFGDAFIR